MRADELAAYCRDRCATGSVSPCENCRHRAKCDKLERIVKHSPAYEFIELVQENKEINTYLEEQNE